jgi:uncharacterized linocin/CFP29 family protein
MSIKDGDTKVFVELYVNFTLTSNQVQQEARLMTCHTLARMAAKILALAEDRYFFQLSDRAASRDPDDPASSVKMPGKAKIENWRFQADLGLLAEANPGDADDANPDKVAQEIQVSFSGGTAIWGENTFAAVADGIATLVSKGQAKGYALILPTKVYADTFDPPSPQSLVTTAERIEPLVKGGFYSSGILPEDEGLLVALAGEPIRLYVGRKPIVEFVRKDGAKYYFRVVERIQYVVRDPRAMVLMKFVLPGADVVANAIKARDDAAVFAETTGIALDQATAAHTAGERRALTAAKRKAKVAAKRAAAASRDAANAADKADDAGRQEATAAAADAAASAMQAANDAARADALAL